MPTMERLPQPVHEGDEVSPAPGDLELVRSFVSLHDHGPGSTGSLEPTLGTMMWWLHSQDLIPADVEPTGSELAWVMEVRAALVAKVRENMGTPPDPALGERLNQAADDAGLRPRFDEPGLEVTTDGARGAVGKILGITFLAELDGSWHRFRMCADPTCHTAFYDRSKNHSAKWCSMSSCGNRNKVRMFRERHSPGS